MRTKLVTSASAAALAVAITSPAFAGPTYENDTGGSFTWYGQLNPSFQSYDDGTETYNRLVDNAGSNSRIGFRLKQAYGENSLTFHFETAFGFRSSDGVSQASTGDNLSWDRTNIRHVDLQYDTARFGRFSVGQGSMASDGIAGSDRSGTGVVAGVAVADPAGGYEFTGGPGGVSVGDVFTDYDGGRLGRVRYDSNNYNGFVFSASYGTDILKTNNDRETYDVAVRYNNENIGDFALDAALGAAWTEETGKDDKRDIAGSVALEHMPTGLSLALVAGERDIAGSYGYAKLGYSADWTPLGSTSFSVDYYDGSDMASTGDSAQSWGVAAVQKIDSHNVEAYLAYREYSYDDTSTSYNDSSVIMAGARWKF